MTRALRVTGWTLIAAGAVVLLYLVYSLFFTTVATNTAQAELSQQWERQLGQLRAAAESTSEDADRDEEDDGRPAPTLDVEGAVAVLEFSRPGSHTPVVHDDPLYVVDGVTRADLTRGPGHYPDTAAPGAQGNVAIAGHRTTYGAPFYHLDQLAEGDEVHVTDPAGQRFTYRVASRQIVAPDEWWVIGADPRSTGKPTLTLTTCHPRFSAAQRMVVFAELVE